MQAFSDDGTHLAFIDGFGLTRVSLPNKVKTDRAVTAGFGAMLSRDRAGALLLAWREPWDQSYLYSFPALSAAQKFKRFELSRTLLRQDGGAFVQFGTYFGQTPVTTARVWTDAQTATEPVDLATLPVARALDPVRLGPRASSDAPGWLATQSASAPDGTFAVLAPGPLRLIAGAFGERPGEAPFRVQLVAPLGVAPGSRVVLEPARGGGVTVWEHDATAGRAAGVALDPSGAQRRVEFAAIGVPVTAAGGDAVVYQRSGGEVVRRRWSDGAEQVFRVPEAHAGPGRVLAHGDAVYLLPWHAEALLDLASGAVIDRKLPERERAVRRFMREQIRALNAVGAAANMHFELADLSFHAKHPRFGYALSSTAGDGTLLAAFVAGYANSLARDKRLEDLDGYRWQSAGGVSDQFAGRAADEGEVLAAFAHLDARGVSALVGCDRLSELYEPRVRGRAGRASEPPGLAPAPVTHAGEAALLRGLLEAAAELDARDIAARVRRAQGEALSAEHVLARLRAIRPGQSDRVPYRMLGTFAALAVHHFDVAALPVLEYLLLEAPEEYRTNSSSDILEVLQGVLARHPDKRAAVLAEARRRLGGASDRRHVLDWIESRLKE